jgi:hypothetical protein
MKKTLFLSAAACSMLALFSCGNAEKNHDEHNTTPKADSTAVATTQPEATPETPPMDSAAMAKAWENYATPGDMQKWLASQDGKWKGEMISFDGPGGAASAPSEMAQENKMVMGGRYQESTVKGKMMGMDYEGRGLMAYDNAKKKFVSTWIDNMGTGIMMTEGIYNEADKSLDMKGLMTDPSTGKDTHVRQLYRFTDDNTQVMEMYCEMNGKETKTLEIKMTKK